MIILDATTKSLQFKLGAAITTNQLPFAASYIDSNGTATTPGEQDGTSSGTTAVTAVASPDSSTQRLVKSLMIQNADTASATVTVIYNNNATLRNVFIATLAVGDQLVYEDSDGWSVIDSQGNLKTGSSGNSLTSTLSSGNIFVGNASNVATGVPVSGDASISNSGALTIANNAVTNAKAAQMAANTIKGNNTGSSANASDLTVAQVLAMLNISSAVVLYNYISGLLPTLISGTSTTASITITAGQAADSTNTTMLSGGSFSWAVSNGAAINGYQGGATLPNSGTIHFYICSGSSGTGTFASSSLSPTLPTGYNSYYRRIFSLRTNSSGALIGGTAIETDGGALTFWLATPVQDVATTSIGSTSRAAQTLTSIPTGVKFEPIILAMNNGIGQSIWLSSGDEPDTAPAAESSTTTSPGCTLANANTTVGVVFVPFQGTTNTSAQIFARGNSGTSNSLYITTRGWKDFRRS